MYFAADWSKLTCVHYSVLCVLNVHAIRLPRIVLLLSGCIALC